MSPSDRNVDDAVEDEVIEVEAQAEQQNFLARFISSSPWLAIAIMLHVIIFGVLSVWYLASGNKTEGDERVINTAIREAPVLPPPIEKPPEIIDRNSVPLMPDQQEGPVNPDEVTIPDAAAGRKGEITDEVDPTKDPGIYNPDPEALSNLPSGATGGTPIGVGAVGHFGTGVPSAFSSRRAGGGGKGGGGLGQGGGGGPGGKRSEESVQAALIWLKNHQSPDGRWDSDGFDAQCTKTPKCDGKGDNTNDVGLTGLALLCFLGANYTHMNGPFKNTVKSGLKYLMSVQDQDGCFGSKSGKPFQYNHACAALAMAEAYGMTQAKPFHDPAQKGLDFVMRSQNPYMAWRYGVADGDNDSSVTGWMVMALKSGKMAGLAVDEGSIRNALGWIDQMTDNGSGRTGYQTKGGLPARVTDRMEKFPADKSESLTAVGMLVRIFAGHGAGDDPLITKGAELLLAKTPKWDEGTGEIDMYYWYYGSLAMFQVGGKYFDKWNEAMKTAIIDHQHMDSKVCLYGSWDPLDPWSVEGGRVYSTAVNCLCMEVYYRYPRVFGMHKEGAPGEKKDDKNAGK